jgi:DNA polymerase-3 subunit epsilon
MTTDQAVALLDEHTDYQLLKRVPEELFDRGGVSAETKRGLIIDLETMGTNYQKDLIIEIGMIGFEYTADGQITKVDSTYNELNDPGKKIPKDIIAITGITNDDVKGKAIDWQQVAAMLEPADIIICHNSGFDRKFMEKQTPDEIREIVETKSFGCTFNDIHWKGFGIESSKLDYINWKLGYFYGSHRALTDCWATLNVLDKHEKAFSMLLANSAKVEHMICAINAPFEKKNLLKGRRYRWSDGSGNLPKCWWTTINKDRLEEEKAWLDETIYGKPCASSLLPQVEISSINRFSERAEKI